MRLFGLLSRALRKLKRSKWIDPTRLHVFQETEHLRRLFEYLAVDIVYDIGANQGQYATMLREKVGYRGVIVSVEPIPEMADAIRKKAKNDPLWYVEQLVVADTPGTRTFHVMQDRECSSLSVGTLSDTTSYEAQTTVDFAIKVESITLAALVTRWQAKHSNLTHPYLKLDTQGYDSHILKSAPETVKSFAAFQSELSVKRLYESSVLIEDILATYKGYGFDVSALIPNNAGHFPDLIELDCIMIRRDLCAQAST